MPFIARILRSRNTPLAQVPIGSPGIRKEVFDKSISCKYT
jgi:hypothetical protein